MYSSWLINDLLKAGVSSRLRPGVQVSLIVFPIRPYKKDIKLIGSIQNQAMKMMEGLVGKVYEEKLRALGLF